MRGGFSTCALWPRPGSVTAGTPSPALTDRELGRRFTHLLCDQMNNGLIVRELHWQLERRGFGHVAVTPQVRIGALTPEEGSLLLADLRERAADGRYFLARTYYSAIAAAT